MTGYKWLARYDADGRRGLRDRSHAPHHCPHRIRSEITDLLCAGRRRHADWGPEKLLDWLAPRHPRIAAAAWPAVSTAGDLLAREGLVKKRRRGRPHQHPGVVPPTTHAPNDRWATDFKEQFPTRDGVWCFPLTISDSTRAICSPVEGCRTSEAVARVPSSSGPSVSSGCRGRSGPPTAGRSRRRGSTGSHNSRFGGRGWGSSISASIPPRPRRMARMSGCTKPSRPALVGHRAQTSERSSVASMAFAPCTTTSGRTRRSGTAPQLALHRLVPTVSRTTAAARVSRTLPGQADHECRHLSVPAQTPLHRQRAQTT